MPGNNSTKASVRLNDQRQWINRHQTVKQRVAGIYTVWNADSDNKLATYNATTEALQWLVKEAGANGSRLHALGGGWSLSPVGATNGYLVNTKPLRLRFRINKDRISSSYNGNPANLIFVQCGNSITRLNRYLKANKKSLRTSGSSNGQTVVGALSTGTHGSRIDFGAFQEFVVGLHVIVGSKRHIWLERKSYPVAVPDFAARLGAERIQDDELFNAALVSFGSFGFIHGAMIETERRFLLEAYRVWLPYNDAMKEAIKTLKFSSLNLPDRKQPYHFEVVFNPNEPLKRTYVTVMYKRPYRPDYPHLEREVDEPGLGDGALNIVGRIFDVLPSRLTRPGLNKAVESEYEEYGPKWGTTGEIFSSETVRGKTLSAAMAVPLSFAEKALNAAYAAHKDHDELYPGLISLRYAKGSDALLAFTRFDDSAVLEIDSVYSDGALRFLKKVWKKLNAEDIPYTVHWGKINELNTPQVRRMYGDSVEKWIAAREKLLDAPTREIFSNAFLEKVGLAS